MPGPARTAFTAVFLRIGNFTFGGGDPAMSALRRELVDKRGWMTAEQYTLVWSLARITPGTNVLAFCAGAGWIIAGAVGAILAAVAACLPAAVLCYYLVVAAARWESNPWVAASIGGISAAVVGMMASAAALMLAPGWRGGKRVSMIAVCAAGFAASAWLGWSPVRVLAAAFALGWWSAVRSTPRGESAA